MIVISLSKEAAVNKLLKGEHSFQICTKDMIQISVTQSQNTAFRLFFIYDFLNSDLNVVSCKFTQLIKALLNHNMRWYLFTYFKVTDILTCFEIRMSSSGVINQSVHWQTCSTFFNMIVCKIKGKVVPVLNKLSTKLCRYRGEQMYRSTFSWPQH
jgi:hypothetical protein